jgi:hypothetical protein
MMPVGVPESWSGKLPEDQDRRASISGTLGHAEAGKNRLAMIRMHSTVDVGLEPAAECSLSSIVSDSNDADQPSRASQKSGT